MASRTWQFEGYAYREAGRMVGPVSEEAVEELVRANVLRPSDQIWTVWTDGDQKRMIDLLIREAIPVA